MKWPHLWAFHIYQIVRICKKWQGAQSRKQVETHGSWNMATLKPTKLWLRQETIYDVPVAADMNDDERSHAGPRAQSRLQYGNSLAWAVWPRIAKAIVEAPSAEPTMLLPSWHTFFKLSVSSQNVDNALSLKANESDWGWASECLSSFLPLLSFLCTVNFGINEIHFLLHNLSLFA